MLIDNNAPEPTEDDIYLAKMTMDEVGADIEEHGHVAVTDENRTQDPFTTKGSLANALDEALDYSNPNYDPTNESQGDIEGITNDPQSPKKCDEEIKPDDTTMDKAPKVPDAIASNKESKTVKDSLSAALDSVFAMDAVTEVPEEADDEAHHKWQREEIEKNVPKIPESMGGGDKPDSNGLIYLDYTFTVDPEKYNSPNYQPIADAGKMGNGASNAVKNPNEQAATDKVDEEVSLEETKVEAGGEPSKDAEKVAAKEANENEKEVASIGKPIDEKKTEDEAPEKVVLDYATFIDGSSFLCFDEDTGVDYTKIAMDAGPKKPVTRQTCKTTFAQCRAKNPLFCRFHGPKLLEKDIKSAISAALGKGCVVSVTKDKGQKNPLTFRLTIGCPPAMKKDVEKIVHMFMTQNPGISSPEEYKDLGNGKQTTEFDMDILKADEPPKKGQVGGHFNPQPKEEEEPQQSYMGKSVGNFFKGSGMFGSKKEEKEEMPVVGETPPKVEKLANEGGVQKTETPPQPVEEVKENIVTEKEEEIDEGGNPKGEATKEKIEENVEQPKGGDGLDLEAIKNAISNSTRKLGFSLYYPNDFKIIPTDTGFTVKGQAGLKGSNDVLEEIISAVEDLGYDTKGYDSQSAQIEFYPKKPVSDVKGVEGEKKDEVEGRKESALAKVKEVLKGTKYENADLKYSDFGSHGQVFSAAKTDYGELYLSVSDNGELNVGIGSPQGTNWYDSIQDAIKDFDEYYGGSANGGKDSSANSANAPSGFHFADDAAMKMTGDIDDLAHQNPELISSDDNVSALYYGAQQAINAVDEAKKNLEEIDKKLKEFEDSEDNGLSASDVLAKLTLKNSKKAQQEAYDDAKAHAELSVNDFKEAVEKAKANVVDAIKGTNAEMVENIVKTTARAIFPNGKPDGVDSVVDMIDALDKDMVYLANDKLMVNGKVSPENISKVHTIQDKYSFQKKYKDVEKASQDFDGAISSFKDLIDGVKSKDGAESLKEAVNGISEYSQKLKDAFAAYKMAVDNVKKDVSDFAEMKAKEKELNQGETNQGNLDLIPKIVQAWHNITKLNPETKSYPMGNYDAHHSSIVSVNDPFSKSNAEAASGSPTGVAIVYTGKTNKWTIINKINDLLGKVGLGVVETKKKMNGGQAGKDPNIFDIVIKGGEWGQQPIDKPKLGEKKLSQNSVNDQPSQDEILDAAKKLAINMSINDDSSTAYYAKQISDIISGEGFPKSVDKQLPNIGSRRDLAKHYLYMARHYLYMLKDLDGVSPSVIAALQKVVDMPKWGEKTKKKTQSQNSSENTMDLSGDFAKYVGLDTEASGKAKSASADFYPNLANAISAALQKDGHFTNFNTTNDYDSHSLYLSVEKKQKEGFDEDEDMPEIPTDEESSNVEYMLQRELGKVGLALDYGTAKQSGPKLTWKIVAKPKATKKTSKTAENANDVTSNYAKAVGLYKEPVFNVGAKSPPPDYFSNITHAAEEALKNNEAFTNVKVVVNQENHKMYMKIEKKQPQIYLNQIIKATQKLNIELGKIGMCIAKAPFTETKDGKKIKWEIEPKAEIAHDSEPSPSVSSSNSKSDIKAKIAAMSVKEKMEKSIPLLEKKIKAEPNNEKWQKMLKIAKAYLASHKD